MGIAVTATRSSTTEPMLVGDACVMMEFHDPRIATWRWFRHGVLRSSSHRARRPRRAPGTLSLATGVSPGPAAATERPHPTLSSSPCRSGPALSGMMVAAQGNFQWSQGCTARPACFLVRRARLDRDRDGLLVFFVCIILFRVAAAVYFLTHLLVAAAPVVVLASLVTVSHVTSNAPRRVVGQWGGAGGAICEDHLAFWGLFTAIYTCRRGTRFVAWLRLVYSLMCFLLDPITARRIVRPE